MPQNRSSYGGGSARAGNRLQQLYSLSGRATLADLPQLYGMAGGVGGGGREKDSGMGGGFQGEPMAAEGPGPGSGGSGLFAVSPPPSPGLPGPFPSDPNGRFPSAVNPAFRQRAGEGGDFGGAEAAHGLSHFGAADFSLGNLAEAAQFGLGLTSGMGVMQMGLQGLGHLALPGTIPSPLPEFTGQFNPADYLTAEEMGMLSGAYNSTMARHIQARLMGLARQRHEAEMLRGDIRGNANAGGGVGSGRARAADRAPGGPIGGPGL